MREEGGEEKVVGEGIKERERELAREILWEKVSIC